MWHRGTRTLSQHPLFTCGSSPGSLTYLWITEESESRKARRCHWVWHRSAPTSRRLGTEVQRLWHRSHLSLGLRLRSACVHLYRCSCEIYVRGKSFLVQDVNIWMFSNRERNTSFTGGRGRGGQAGVVHPFENMFLKHFGLFQGEFYHTSLSIQPWRVIFLTDFCRANEGVAAALICSSLASSEVFCSQPGCWCCSGPGVGVNCYCQFFFLSHKLNIFGTTIMWIIFWSRFEELSFIWAFIAAVDVINS